MRGAWLVLFLMVPLGGCVDPFGGGGRPPIAGPPKLVVNYGPDDRTEVYVHASVGEINYTRITLRLDNATENATADGGGGFHQAVHAYALDIKLEATRFHANVTVQDRRTLWGFTSTLSINATARPPELTARLPDGSTVRTEVPLVRVLERIDRPAGGGG